MSHNAEIDPLEWQVAEGSRTLHIIDTTTPAWRNPDGSRRRSGPRSLCGKYPQRNAETPWWSWPVRDSDASTGRTMLLRQCEDCRSRVIPSGVPNEGADQ